MFNSYESSDERKRDAMTARRLMSLRCAYMAGYFKEPIYFKDGLEPVPEIVADGVSPADQPKSTALVKRFDYTAEEEAALDQWRKASNFLDRMRRMPPGGGPGTCPTCGRPEVMFVNGVCPGCGPAIISHMFGAVCPTCGMLESLFGGDDCPKCNPPISKSALDSYAEMERLERELKAIGKVCPVCFGFGTTDPDDVAVPRKCRKCGGKGLIE